MTRLVVVSVLAIFLMPALGCHRGGQVIQSRISLDPGGLERLPLSASPPKTCNWYLGIVSASPSSEVRFMVLNSRDDTLQAGTLNYERQMASSSCQVQAGIDRIWLVFQNTGTAPCELRYRLASSSTR